MQRPEPFFAMPSAPSPKSSASVSLACLAERQRGAIEYECAIAKRPAFRARLHWQMAHFGPRRSLCFFFKYFADLIDIDWLISLNFLSLPPQSSGRR